MMNTTSAIHFSADLSSVTLGKLAGLGDGDYSALLCCENIYGQKFELRVEFLWFAGRHPIEIVHADIIGNDEMGLTIADRHAKKFRAVLADALEEAAAAGDYLLRLTPPEAASCLELTQCEWQQCRPK